MDEEPALYAGQSAAEPGPQALVEQALDTCVTMKYLGWLACACLSCAKSIQGTGAQDKGRAFVPGHHQLREAAAAATVTAASAAEPCALRAGPRASRT